MLRRRSDRNHGLDWRFSTATILAQEDNAVGLGTVGGQEAELRGAFAEGVHAGGTHMARKDATFVFERPMVRLRLSLKAGAHVFADALDGDFDHALVIKRLQALQ